ncbi:hypothetical protein NL676_033070 [Syzygium grande]|nr:hypothetical protein NL676_033070 [Syzygium grande]
MWAQEWIILSRHPNETRSGRVASRFECPSPLDPTFWISQVMAGSQSGWTAAPRPHPNQGEGEQKWNKGKRRDIAGWTGRARELEWQVDGDGNRVLLLLLASRASPSHSSNIGACAAAATAATLPSNHSHGLAGSSLIADDMGLEYLIDSPHVRARILAGNPPVTYATIVQGQPAGCGRPPQKGKPYRPCLPKKNREPTCKSVYDRSCNPT